MQHSLKIIGKNIQFSFVTQHDAEFILSLRTDENYNKHLSDVTSDISKQVDWIINYKKREFEGDEYYFIIERKDNNEKIGTVRIYDFDFVNNSFCWGSWILNDNKTKLAALESAILIYDFCFNNLRFNRCHMDIRKGNIHVQKFHQRFGVQFVAETDQDIIGHYFKVDYVRLRKDFIKSL
jgi:RimJ/RimL family protein N-acetyltransferase